MRTPIGRVRRGSLVLLLLIAATIVTGLILPGHTGTIVQVAGWIALAILIILEVGIRSTTTPTDWNGNDRRPYCRLIVGRVGWGSLGAPPPRGLPQADAS